MKSHHRPRRRRLPQAHICHGAAAAQDTDPALPPPRVAGNAVEHVAAAAHLEDVRAERVGALPGDDHRRLGLVFRPLRPPSWPPPAHVAGAALLRPIFSRERVRLFGVFLGFLLVVVMVVEVWSLETLNEARSRA